MKSSRSTINSRMRALFSRDSSSLTVVVEIGARFIKAVESRASKKGPLFRAFRIPVPEEKADDTAPHTGLAQVLASSGIRRKRLVVNIPRHQLIVRFIQLPSVDDAEIGIMMRIESVKHIPSTSEEAVVGYRIAEKRADGYSSICLAIAQTTMIETILVLARGAQCTIDRIAVGSESLYAWHVARRASAAEDAGKVRVVINIDAEYLDIDIIERGTLSYTRGAESPGEAQLIVGEIKKTIVAFEKSRTSHVDEVVVCGATDISEAVVALLKAETDASVTFFDQRQYLPRADGVPSEDVKASSFIELIGAALKPDEVKIDLLPEQQRTINASAMLKKNLKMTVVLSAAIALILSVTIGHDLYIKMKRLSGLNAQIRAMAPDVAKAKKIKADVDIMKEMADKKVVVVDVLREVSKITPEGVTFTMVDYEAGESVTLKGSAPLLENIVAYISTIERSLFFENAKLKYSTKRTIGQTEQVDFEIVAAISKKQGG